MNTGSGVLCEKEFSEMLLVDTATKAASTRVWNRLFIVFVIVLVIVLAVAIGDLTGNTKCCRDTLAQVRINMSFLD